MDETGPTFANARHLTGSAEHNHWAAAGNETFDAKVKPVNDRLSFLEDGGSFAGGGTAVLASGHTPGQMGYMLASDGAQSKLIADLANHPVWSLDFPDWEGKFDMDKAMAAKSLRTVLGMLAADKVPMNGYHMPWPATGYVETHDDGFR